MSSKRYPDEFKIEAVKQVVELGYPVAQAAKRLGITTMAISRHTHIPAICPAPLNSFIEIFSIASQRQQPPFATSASASAHDRDRDHRRDDLTQTSRVRHRDRTLPKTRHHGDLYPSPMRVWIR